MGARAAVHAFMGCGDGRVEFAVYSETTLLCWTGCGKLERASQ